MTLSAEPDSQEEKFLVDFLYADRPRLSVLAAQLFDDGHLVGIKRSAQSGVDSLMKFKGGLPGVAGGEASNTEKAQDAIERQFDASWASPLNVIRELSERELWVTDIESASFGQLVLVRGQIYVADVRMFQKLWKPIVRMQSAKGASPAVTNAQKRKASASSKETEQLLDLVEHLPHSLQFRISNDDVACWATLEPEQLTINAANLAFKHGASIPGEWIAIGVLDARPDSLGGSALAAMVNADSNPLKPALVQILTALRQMFGRSESDFGFTPLAIYRVIEKAD